MIDYRLMEQQIHRAHVERNAYVGELIGNGILAAWSGAIRFAHDASAKMQAMIERPDQPKTLPPAYF